MLKCPTATHLEQKMAKLILRHLMNETSGAMPDYQEMMHIESFHWSTKTFAKGSALIAQEEARNTVSILLDGWAFRFQTLPEGKRQILDFVFSGALLGFGSGAYNLYGVEAVTACTVASISCLQFRRLLIGCPTLAFHVAERVADNEMRAHEHLTGLGRRTARERVAALIVELIQRTGHYKGEPTTVQLELPITQVMIGDALGLTNEHVCRTLAKLVEAGVIELSRHAVTVLDCEAIALEAGIDFPCDPTSNGFDVEAA